MTAKLFTKVHRYASLSSSRGYNTHYERSLLGFDRLRPLAWLGQWPMLGFGFVASSLYMIHDTDMY